MPEESRVSLFIPFNAEWNSVSDFALSGDQVIFSGDVFPRAVVVESRDALEAQAIVAATDVLFGAAAPILKETDVRIVLAPIDRLVQEMVGWRETVPVAPGLPSLMIPPRTAPDGWVERDGVIQKRWGGTGFLDYRPGVFDFNDDRESRFRDQYCQWPWPLSVHPMYKEAMDFYENEARANLATRRSPRVHVNEDQAKSIAEAFGSPLDGNNIVVYERIGIPRCFINDEPSVRKTSKKKRRVAPRRPS